MVYECDNCEATLGPGLTGCPHCGEVFDEPVPADALWDGPVPADVLERAVETPFNVRAAPPEAAVRSRPPVNRHRWLRATAAGLLLLELGWLGCYQWGRSATSDPVLLPIPHSPTDLEAHPDYAAHMAALVEELRATGVAAQWPAFGSNDMLLITPQARAAEPPMAWDADMDRRLAQGIYGDFVLTRHEAGFPDTDAMACFVLVTGASGRVVAVDFMGELK